MKIFKTVYRHTFPKRFHSTLVDKFMKDKVEDKLNQQVDQDYLKLLENNKKYVDSKLAEDPLYFKKRAAVQKPKYMIIGCADSRVPPNEMTNTSPGEIFIHRNVANLVVSSDVNCMSTVQFAIEGLGVEHIIVLGHTKCGGVKASVECNHIGLIDQWLQHIRDVAVNNRAELEKYPNKEDFIERLAELNAKQQALNLCKTPFVQRAWEQGKKLQVHAWICNIETGILKDLDLKVSEEWTKISRYYKFNFH
jgi:carbonic anhydrase